MKKTVLLFLPVIYLISTVLMSCSAYMAVSKPDKKNLNVLTYGTHRNVVLAELGAPIRTDKNPEGLIEDTWCFKQGDSKFIKGSKAVTYIAADVFTLGLWEIVGVPAELVMEKGMKTYIVRYDKSEKITNVNILGK